MFLSSFTRENNISTGRNIVILWTILSEAWINYWGR